MIHKGINKALHRTAPCCAWAIGLVSDYLASRAKLSLPTVKRVEAGFGPRVSDEARAKLRHALEAAGIEFLEENGRGAGVRFRKPLRFRKGRRSS